MAFFLAKRRPIEERRSPGERFLGETALLASEAKSRAKGLKSALMGVFLLVTASSPRVEAREPWVVPLLDQGRVTRSLEAIAEAQAQAVLRSGPWDLLTGGPRPSFSGPFEGLLPSAEPPVVPGTPPVSDPLVGEDWAFGVLVRWEASFLPSNAPYAKTPVLVAVLDSGVDLLHEDLRDSLWRDPAQPLVSGFDFTRNVPGAQDVRVYDLEGCALDYSCRTGADRSRYLVNPGHGTHVAGHIAAVMENPRGIRGAALGGAKLLPLKIFYDAGHPNAGRSEIDVVVRAIDYAITKGAKILHASWGATMTTTEAAESPLRAALLRARDAGMLVVAAAGNDGRNLDGLDSEGPDAERTYPAGYSTEMDHVIAVGASTRQDRLAQFSAYGRETVQILAPGVEVFSTMVGSIKYGDHTGHLVGGAGEELAPAWDGTSMAAPLVTGAVAALWSRNPEWSAARVKSRVLTRGRGCRFVPLLVSSTQCGGVIDLKGLFGI